jgi:hypothetical protein
MGEQTQTLADAYTREQERCRELICMYRSLPNNAGHFAESMIRETLRRADRAAMEGDTVAMMGLLREMKEHA